MDSLIISVIYWKYKVVAIGGYTYMLYTSFFFLDIMQKT
jgi:hypothetical protein